MGQNINPCEDFELALRVQDLKADLDSHLELYYEQRKIDDERWQKVISAQEANTEAIRALAESTRGLVEAWDAGAGVVKVMSVLASVGKWAAGVSLLVYTVNAFKDRVG
jgi:hypothetical protein